MNFVQRSIGILTQPKVEFPKAAAEPATTGGLIGGYAAILAALPALGALLGLLLFAGRALGYIIGPTLLALVLWYALRDLGLTIVMGIIAAALAPSFGGQRDSGGAMKLVIYAATPIWIAGFLGALLAPVSGALFYLLLLAGFAYAGYLIYLGCRAALGVPEQQAGAVAGILTVIWLVLYFVVNMIVERIFLSAMFSGSGYGYY